MRSETHDNHAALVRAIALLAVAAAGLPGGVVFGQQSWRFETNARVVAFGDVHGAYDGLVDLLRATGLVDEELHWNGGGAHAVSLGDLLDRGARSRDVLELVMRLQREAAAAGGRLHVVLGNHELMNLLGDWRYVAATEYASFASEESESARAAAYASFAAGAASGDSPATRQLFDARYPRGFFARQAAFAPAGRYGAWLRSLPAIVVINDTVYVHGGLPPVIAERTAEINERVWSTLERYLALRDRLVAAKILPAIDRQSDAEAATAAPPPADPELAAAREEFLAAADATELGIYGPMWYRGSIYCKPMLEEPTLEAVLGRLRAARAVVGHTPTADRRARSLYGGRLVTLDTGMLTEYFHGRPAALVVEGGTDDVRYVSPPENAPLEIGATVAYALTAVELRTALERGDVVSVERPGGLGSWQVALRYDGTSIGAAFYPRRGDRASDFELAAAALDDLLGTDLVAPTVARTIEGEQGALQLRYADAVTETARVARGLPLSGWCPIEPQLTLVHAFDVLVLNRARTADNLLFNNDLTDLTLVEHGQAFAVERALPAGFDPRGLKMPPALLESLRSLDEAKLRAALGAWLDTRRIRALLARRDRLVLEP